MSIQCRDCSEPLIFARTTGGHNIPFDRIPNTRGRMLILPAPPEMRGGGRIAIHEAAATDEQRTKHGPDRYICHWDTCTNPTRIH